MEHSWFVDGGEGLQMWRVTPNVTNKQPKRGGSPTWGLGKGLTTPFRKKKNHYIMKCYTEIQNCLKKKGDALSPLIFNFALEYAIMKVQENPEGSEVNEPRKLLLFADGVNVLAENINTIKENRKTI
jgi:hypothetical protein